MRSIYLYAAMAASLMLASCQSETEGLPDAHKAMGIGVSIQTEQTRAMITGTGFAGGTEIGLFVAEADGTKYDGKVYNNVKATSVGTSGSQTWTTASPILLSSTIGKAVAYYPYDAGVTDVTAIDVNIDSQTDYMYSGWVENLSNANPNATFTMKHGLAVLRIFVVRKDYTGMCWVPSIAVQSPGIGKGGKLDATTGELSDITGTDEIITLPLTADNLVLHLEDFSYHAASFLFVPQTSVRENHLNVIVTIDGKPYSVCIPCPGDNPYVQGKIFSYTLNIKATGLVVSGVSIEEWVTENRGSADLSPGTLD